MPGQNKPVGAALSAKKSGGYRWAERGIRGGIRQGRGQGCQLAGRRRLAGRGTIDAGHEAMALAAMLTATVQHILLSLTLLDLLVGNAFIVLVVHGIQHQHVSADDKQQCPDQSFHEGRRRINP